MTAAKPGNLPPTETPGSAAPARTPRSSLVVGGWLWAASAALFFLLAVFAAIYDRFPGDERLTDGFQAVDVPVLGGYLDFVNVLGADWVYVFLTFAACGVFVMRRAGWEAMLVLTTLVPRFVNSLLKELIERPRPSADLVDVADSASGFGFPSGHTVGTAALFVMLFFVIPVVVPWRALSYVLRAGCVLAVVSAGPARVYVGVHWPSDVLGGYLLAGLVVGPLIFGYLKLRSS